MKLSDTYRLFDLVESESKDESLVREIICTLENYEHLKSKMQKCICQDSRLIIEGVCTKCFGLDVTEPKEIVFSWKW